jgi:hypothetical protein
MRSLNSAHVCLTIYRYRYKTAIKSTSRIKPARSVLFLCTQLTGRVTIPSIPVTRADPFINVGWTNRRKKNPIRESKFTYRDRLALLLYKVA